MLFFISSYLFPFPSLHFRFGLSAETANKRKSERKRELASCVCAPTTDRNVHGRKELFAVRGKFRLLKAVDDRRRMVWADLDHRSIRRQTFPISVEKGLVNVIVAFSPSFFLLTDTETKRRRDRGLSIFIELQRARN